MSVQQTGDGRPSAPEGKENEQPDPFKFDDLNDEGGWLRCCPSFIGLGIMTFLMAILGFGFGAILHEADTKTHWLKCYKKSEYSSDELILKPIPFDGDKSCWMEVIFWPGYLWIRTLKLLVIPLMATMVLTLPEKLSKIAPVGIRLLCLLTFTSFIAAMEGLFWGNVLKPGDGIELTNSKDGPGGYISEFESILNIFTLFFPQNIFDELANSRIIGTISFFLVLGIQISNGPRVWADPIFNIGKGIMRAILRILVHVMWFTPIAMFSLIAYNIADVDNVWDVLEGLGKYVGTQLLGQFFHLMFYFGFYFLMTRNNPVTYFQKISQAPMTALATSSSAATMPVTIRVNKEAGNDDRLVQFTIPLGAGMNMDGTSLGFPIMVLFAAQASNETLNAGQQLTLALLAMVCSLGTAPIPSAGLVFLQMLFFAVDLSDGAQEKGFALIAIFDWLVDRVETAQNVTSDSFICGILNHYFQGGTGLLNCCMRGIQPEEITPAENYKPDV